MKNKRILFLVLVLTMTLTISVSFAYWIDNNILGATKTLDPMPSITVGSWLIEDNGFIHYYDDITNEPKVNDPYNYEVFIKGIEVHKFPSIIIYHPDLNRYFVLDNPKDSCFAWVVGGCPNPETTGPYNNKYKHVELAYFNNILYAVGDIVYYNGNLFEVVSAGSANGSLPIHNIYGGWIYFDKQYDSKQKYNNNEKVIFNNQVYIASKGGNKGTPGELNSGWNRYGTLDYVVYNAYSRNDIVIYKEKAYRAVRNNFSNVTPGNAGSEKHWVLADQPG